jgi:hypothetical protein
MRHDRPDTNASQVLPYRATINKYKSHIVRLSVRPDWVSLTFLYWVADVYLGFTECLGLDASDQSAHIAFAIMSHLWDQPLSVRHFRFLD